MCWFDAFIYFSMITTFNILELWWSVTMIKENNLPLTWKSTWDLPFSYLNGPQKLVLLEWNKNKLFPKPEVPLSFFSHLYLLDSIMELSVKLLLQYQFQCALCLVMYA